MSATMALTWSSLTKSKRYFGSSSLGGLKTGSTAMVLSFSMVATKAELVRSMLGIRWSKTSFRDAS